MTEPRDELHTTLTRLHDELHEARSVSAENRHLLTELMDDIRRVLEGEPASPGEAGLRERLEESVYELEDAHPHLVASIRNVVNYLSATGI